MITKEQLLKALEQFVATIENTGGVTLNSKGEHEPIADQDWTDLGDAYIIACIALEREPMVETEEFDAGDED